MQLWFVFFLFGFDFFFSLYICIFLCVYVLKKNLVEKTSQHFGLLLFGPKERTRRNANAKFTRLFQIAQLQKVFFPIQTHLTTKNIYIY